MIYVDKNKSRNFYPWEELDEVGKSFAVDNKYAHQLVYMRNKANKKKDLPERYKAKKVGTHYHIFRIQ